MDNGQGRNTGGGREGVSRRLVKEWVYAGSLKQRTDPTQKLKQKYPPHANGGSRSTDVPKRRHKEGGGRAGLTTYSTLFEEIPMTLLKLEGSRDLSRDGSNGN